MYREAFREGSAAETEGWSVPLFWSRLGAVKWKQRPKIDFGPFLFFEQVEREETRKIWSVPLYGGEGAVKLNFSFFKAAKERDNKSNVDD